MSDTEDKLYRPGTLGEGYDQLLRDHLPRLDRATQSAIIAALDAQKHFTEVDRPAPKHLATVKGVDKATWYAIRDSELKALPTVAAVVGFALAAAFTSLAPLAALPTVSGLVLAWRNYRAMRIELTDDQYSVLVALKVTGTLGATPEELGTGPAHSPVEVLAVLESLKNVRRENNTRVSLVDVDAADGRWRAADV